MALPKGHLAIARKGEIIACNYLRQNGYDIINRNVTFGKDNSEIDIVARQGDMIVFVEVKTKERDDGIAPSYKVDKRKVATLRRLAQIWLDRRTETLGEDLPARIDVIGVCEGVVVEHYEDITG